MARSLYEDSNALLSRAHLFRLLARGFGYPEPGHVREMAALFRDLRGASRVDAHRAGPELRRAQRAWSSREEQALREEYARLFLGGAAVALRETAYGGAHRIASRAVELADIGGFYTAFGLEPSRSNPELPDHIAAELEFYSLLLAKEAWRGARGWSGRRAVVRGARRKFLEAHLGRWVESLAREIARHEAAAPYRTLGRLLETAVADEAKRMRRRPDRLGGPLPRDFMQAETFSCPRTAIDAA